MKEEDGFVITSFGFLLLVISLIMGIIIGNILSFGFLFSISLFMVYFGIIITFASKLQKELIFKVIK